VQNLPVIDTFQFGGANDTPAVVDFRVEWEATGPAVSHGMGSAVAATDPGAFLGEIAPAVSTGSFSGEEFGFAFESNRGASTSPRGYAQTYEKVDRKSEASGTLTAPFPGIHGWYWENTTDQEITITLTTAGYYNLSHEFRSGQPTKNKTF